MTITQRDKAIRFRTLHEQPDIFILPNPWDAGSSRVLARLGFHALATSSFASSGVHGRRDGGLSMTETLGHVRAIVEATDLPVSGDLGDHFTDDVEGVAQVIQRAAEAGLVGCSIEDGRTGTQQPLMDNERTDILGNRARRCWRQTNQSRRIAVSCSDDGLARRRARASRFWYIDVRRAMHLRR